MTRPCYTVRGYDDEEDNFMQLMKTRAEGDIALQKWITEGRSQSPDLNKLISLMGNELLWQILNNVKEVCSYC